jgi:hypothetical protein
MAKGRGQRAPGPFVLAQYVQFSHAQVSLPSKLPRGTWEAPQELAGVDHSGEPEHGESSEQCLKEVGVPLG